MSNEQLINVCVSVADFSVNSLGNLAILTNSLMRCR